MAPLNRSTYTPGQSIALSANAADAEDGPSVARQWAIHRLHNGQLVQNVFTHTGPTPPSFAVPNVGQPGDRISYLVEARAVDLAGDVAVDRAHVIPASPPANGAPTASFVGSPSVGSAPLEVHADATESSDPDGDVLLYEWDFGDGTTGFGVSVSHTYTVLNPYTVTLTVSDAAGAQSTSTFNVNVSVARPRRHLLRHGRVHESEAHALGSRDRLRLGNRLAALVDGDEHLLDPLDRSDRARLHPDLHDLRRARRRHARVGRRPAGRGRAGPTRRLPSRAAARSISWRANATTC